MTKKIAIIFEDKLYNQRGRFNAIRNRIKHLSDIADFSIDVFLITTYDPWYVRILRRTKKVERVKQTMIDGITYHVIWKRFSIIDYLLEEKLYRSPLFSPLFYKRIANRLTGYQLLSAHSGNPGWVAEMVAKRDHVPFFVTWHGSDIHTLPFQNTSIYSQTQRLLQSATCNFFVSKALSETAHRISPSFKYEILYNGVNKSFYRYDDEQRKQLRKQYGVAEEEKVIAFVGDLLGIKNPRLLPFIFKSVKEKYQHFLKFWVIGSGDYAAWLKDKSESLQLNVTFWGAQPPDDMPKYMNCIDVLVLPSQNEGMPLVTAEALACGANAVGSDVGGIAESVGKENVYPLGDTFVEHISQRIAAMLMGRVSQPLGKDFDWSVTAKKEKEIYDTYLSEQ